MCSRKLSSSSRKNVSSEACGGLAKSRGQLLLQGRKKKTNSGLKAKTGEQVHRCVLEQCAVERGLSAVQFSFLNVPNVDSACCFCYMLLNLFLNHKCILQNLSRPFATYAPHF